MLTMIWSALEVSVFLVGTAVFKTDVARHPGQAGSIPVHLRQVCTPRFSADISSLTETTHVCRGYCWSY